MQGQATYNEYKEVIRVSRNETMKPKIQFWGPEINLDKNIKENKKGFFKYINN